jgi:hypothetical protein
MKKILILGLIFSVSLLISTAVLAQDDGLSDTDTVTVTAEDLEVTEPTVLPTNTFGYFFKNLGRAISTTFTFDAEKKAELQLRHANERLLEIQKMAEESPDDAKVQALIEKSQAKYEQLMDKVSSRVEKLQEQGQTDKVDRLLDKISDKQFKQQKVLDVIENKISNASPEQLNKLQETKDRVLERFGETLDKVEGQNKIQERLQNASQNQNGDGLSQLKNLEIMERLGDNITNENLKEGLAQAKEQIRERVIDDLQAQPNTVKVNQFRQELDNLSNDEAMQLRVYNFLDEGLQEGIGSDGNLIRFRSNLQQVEQIKLESLKDKLEIATSDVDREKLLKNLKESNDLNSVEVLERVKNQVQNENAKEAIEQAQERQLERVEQRIDSAEGENLNRLKQEINSWVEVKNQIQNNRPEVMQKLNDKAASVNQQTGSGNAGGNVGQPALETKTEQQLKPVQPLNQPTVNSGDNRPDGSLKEQERKQEEARETERVRQDQPAPKIEFEAAPAR